MTPLESAEQGERTERRELRVFRYANVREGPVFTDAGREAVVDGPFLHDEVGRTERRRRIGEGDGFKHRPSRIVGRSELVVRGAGCGQGKIRDGGVEHDPRIVREIRESERVSGTRKGRHRIAAGAHIDAGVRRFDRTERVGRDVAFTRYGKSPPQGGWCRSLKPSRR